jgi:hypothetical protein
VDLIPTINVIVHREGEAVEAVVAAVPEAAPEAPPTEAAVDKVESEVAEAVE